MNIFKIHIKKYNLYLRFVLKCKICMNKIYIKLDKIWNDQDLYLNEKDLY